MSENVTITIDGTEVSVPAGTTVVDAAKRIGLDIPVFCHHPKLEPVGMCRMCLVRIGLPQRDRSTNELLRNEDGSIQYNWGRTLQTGCTVRVADGMAVQAGTAEVEAARDDIIEFLLTSHPLDCPICDKGGECPLQELTMRHGAGVSRFDFTMKMKLAKHVPLGDLIVLDRERCIQCARCIRFQDEIVDDPVIAFHERGRHLEIVTNSEPGFDSIWSGNTTDICPVGALTTTDFRFGARPWELSSVATVCTHCPVGCNMSFNVRREARSGGRQVIKRIMPRQNEQVNEIWICDKGRFVHHFADHPDRLTTPLMRRGDELVPVSWEEALQAVADRLQLHQESVAGVAGERLSNEDYFLFQSLFRNGLQSNNLDLANSRLGGGDVVAQVGIAAGSNLLNLGEGDAILVVASDLHQEAPVWWLRVKQAADRGATLVVLNARPTRLDKHATYVHHYAAGDALAAAHHLLSLSKIDMGNGNEGALQAAAAALVNARNLVAFYGGEGLTYAESEVLARILGNLLLLKDENGASHTGREDNGLIAVWPHANTQGAWDMGIRPDAGPGYQTLATMGKQAAEIYEDAQNGALRALYVLGADPVGDGLMAGRGELAFLVVQELFLTETAQLADVVLPAQSWAEREGTYTNGERRVQRFFPAIPAFGQSRPDWLILAEIGERLGMGKPAVAASLVFSEIAQTVPHYQGMTYRTLGRVEKQWPDVGGEDYYYGGTAFTNNSGLGQQWPAGAESQETAQFELPELAVPALQGLPLITATALYRAGTLINRTPHLEDRLVHPELHLSAEDAAQLQVMDGDVLPLELNNRPVEARVHVNGTTLSGLAVLKGVEPQPGRTSLEIERVAPLT